MLIQTIHKREREREREKKKMKPDITSKTKKSSAVNGRLVNGKIFSLQGDEATM